MVELAEVENAVVVSVLVTVVASIEDAMILRLKAQGPLRRELKNERNR